VLILSDVMIVAAATAAAAATADEDEDEEEDNVDEDEDEDDLDEAGIESAEAAEPDADEYAADGEPEEFSVPVVIDDTDDDEQHKDDEDDDRDDKEERGEGSKATPARYHDFTLPLPISSILCFSDGSTVLLLLRSLSTGKHSDSK
jgi:hypothetical protein